ncbi:MAG: hypothetical protein ACRD0I_03115, partial [Acidimicrobiales bacterium]
MSKFNSSSTTNQVIITLASSTVVASTLVTVAAAVTTNPTVASSVYTISESTSADTLAVSSPAYSITVGAANQVAFTTQPSGGTGGSAFGTQPVVTVEDAGGNTVTTDSSSQVTLSITTGTGTAGATLACTTNPVTAVNGVATFAGCKIDKVGSNYKLHATDGILTPADSSPFNVTAGPAATLVFTVQPGGGTSNVAWAQQPQVTLYDAGGNVTTDPTVPVLSITPGTPTSGGPSTLSGCAGTNTSGVVNYTGCKIDRPGTGYQLRATDSAITADSS